LAVLRVGGYMCPDSEAVLFAAGSLLPAEPLGAEPRRNPVVEWLQRLPPVAGDDHVSGFVDRSALLGADGRDYPGLHEAGRLLLVSADTDGDE